MLRAEHLDVGYGGVVALQDCGIEVGDGECVAVLGANGAGKSSLLRTLARAVRQRRGRIEWDGRSIDRWSADRAARAGIALVPEGRRLFPTLTVRENLEVGAARLPSRQARAGVDAVLHWFPQLEPRMDVAAARLSGGEQQMVAVGRALVGGPRLLLVDELSLGLAPLVTKEIYRILAAVVRQGTSVVVVEQYAELAVRAATRVVVLEKGRVAFAGRSAELQGRPDLLETAYLGRELLAEEAVADGGDTAPGASGRRGSRTVPAVAELLVRLEAPLKRRIEADARAAGMEAEAWVREVVRRSRPGAVTVARED